MKACDLPSWRNMPQVDGMPHGVAWGLFDKNGVKDEIGTLNLLTPEVVLNARNEIQTGQSVVMNWSLDRVHEPGFDRVKPRFDVIDWRKKQSEYYSFDDEIIINTQSGSQWDGLRHFGHKETGLYYNGHHHDDVLNGTHLGIDHWSKRGGIVGRGVLLDYVSYAARNNITYDPMSRHAITLSALKETAKEQETTFEEGDILIVRSGWVKWYEEHSPSERRDKIRDGKEWVGVEGCEEVVEWLWDCHFAAIAGDAIGFEAWPPKAPYRIHEHALAFWGMPIGELWDLEGLAAECELQKRWSFFLSSAPLNVPGGIASPPNVLAIF